MVRWSIVFRKMIFITITAVISAAAASAPAAGPIVTGIIILIVIITLIRVHNSLRKGDPRGPLPPLTPLYRLHYSLVQRVRRGRQRESTDQGQRFRSPVRFPYEPELVPLSGEERKSEFGHRSIVRRFLLLLKPSTPALYRPDSGPRVAG